MTASPPGTATSAPDHAPLLYQPIAIGGVTAKNRVMVSPMQMYSADEGRANDYHLVHLGRFALGGAGIVMVEATAVDRDGRVSAKDLGLWDDNQIKPLARIAKFLSAYGAVPGIQLAHAGRKGSAHVPWDGGSPLRLGDATLGSHPWQTVGPSSIPAGSGWPEPRALSMDEIDALVGQWQKAAARAVQAGFTLIEIHAAHGYLLHTFQSPLANRRNDRYGGSFENRIRLLMRVVAAVKQELTGDHALSVRLSTVDGIEGGIDIDDTIKLVNRLTEAGVDAVIASSGGISTDRTVDTRVGRTFGFHTPFSAALMAGTDATVVTVGLIVEPEQGEAILRAEEADLVAIGREALANPNWAGLGESRLTGRAFQGWHQQVRSWLARRARLLARLQDAGETPTGKYLAAAAASARRGEQSHRY